MTRATLVALLLVPTAAFAWGKSKKPKAEEAKPAAPSALKAGIHHQCLRPLAEKKDPAGLMGMGILDQTRGDLAAAKIKYLDAFAAKHDIVASPVDVTYVPGVIWIQTAACPVPVPAAPASETIDASVVKTKLEPTYPNVLLSVRSEGDVQTTVWVGADGKPSRIHVDSVGIGPIGVERIRDPGEELAERQVARVQIALQAIEDLRGHDFGADKAGKSFPWKLSYFPPKDFTENLPGTMPNTRAIDSRRLGDTGLGGGSSK